MRNIKDPRRVLLRGLYPIIDLDLVSPQDVTRVASEILEAGAGVINILQLRAKDKPADSTIKAARELRSLTQLERVLFIINDRIDIALISNADGVHLGLSDIPITEARRLLGAKKIIGLSTHNKTEAQEAVKLGADYISYGPVFETDTKPDASAPGGLEGLVQVVESLKNSNTPITAIGGITETNAAGTIHSGASMAAVISDILLSIDIRAKVTGLINEIGPSPSARREKQN